jgi:hypothetical protein
MSKKLRGLIWLHARFQARFYNPPIEEIEKQMRSLSMPEALLVEGSAARVALTMATWQTAQNFKVYLERISDFPNRINTIIGGFPGDTPFKSASNADQRLYAAALLLGVWYKMKLEEIQEAAQVPGAAPVDVAFITEAMAFAHFE